MEKLGKALLGPAGLLLKADPKTKEKAKKVLMGGAIGVGYTVGQKIGANGKELIGGIFALKENKGKEILLGGVVGAGYAIGRKLASNLAENDKPQSKAGKEPIPVGDRRKE